MPKKKDIELAIPKIYRRNALDLLMFGYVKGARATLHTVTIEAALRQFMEEFEVSDEDYNIESAHVIYNRMQKEVTEVK